MTLPYQNRSRMRRWLRATRAQRSTFAASMAPRETSTSRQTAKDFGEDGGRWNFAFESTGQGIWDCDIPGNTVYYSRMWRLMRGFDADEAVDSSFDAWMERVHPDDRALVLEEMRKQNSPDIRQNAFEYRERHRAGHYIWILSLGAAIEWGPDGKPTRMIGTDTDITARKMAEMEKLHLSRRLELALDSSWDGVVTLDLETMSVVQTNRAFAEMLQRSPEEVVGMHPWECVDASEEEVLDFLETASAEKGNAGLISTRFRRKGGELVDTEVSLSFFEAANQRFAYCTVRDVTESNRTKLALKEATELRRAAVEASQQGILLVEMNGHTITQANHAFADMLNLPPDAIAGKCLWAWAAKEEAGAWRQMLSDSAEKAATLPLVREAVLRRPDGRTIAVDVKTSLIEVGGDRYCHLVVTDMTTSRAAASALKRSETRFQAMFENTRRHIGLLEPDGRYIEANPAIYAFLGVTPDALKAQHFWQGYQWLSEEDRQTVKAAVHRAAGGNYVQLQVRHQSANGAIRVSDLSIAPIADACGTVVQLMTEATDITALEQAKSELEQSERRWNHALESAGQGVWEWEKHNPQTQGSRRWKEMRGYGPDDVIDFTFEGWLSRVHPEDRDRVRLIIEEQANNALEFNTFEYRERHKQGHYIWINSVGAAVEWDADGTPIRRTGTDTDITERKMAEQKVLDLSRRLSLALEASQFGVFELKLESGEVLWDDKLCEMVGVARDPTSMQLTDLLGAMHPDDVAKTILALQRAEENGNFEMEARFIRDDGVVRTLRSRGARFEDEHQEPRLIGVFWDVTEEVALTQSLQVAKELAECRNAELEQAKERIETQSLHDALTGLPNRRYLDKILKRHAATSPSSGAMALLHIDLDGFKQINDTLGHLAGDAMLVHVADLLRENIGLSRFAARVGGDEFIVACPGETDTQELLELANLMINKIRQPVPYHGHQCRFGASIGIAVEADVPFDAQRVLINADVALYQAKGRGRNRCEFFSEALQAEITANKRIADDILRGIEHNEFVPHYQPVLDAKTLEVVGVEALIRWNHPTDGLLSPFRFLKIAENLDVLGTIDHLLLQQALADLNRWQAEGITIPSVSVNVTFQRLRDETLLEGLRKLDIRSGSISFEILESIFLDEFEDCVGRNIAGLQDLGISVDVDDFGTGHTSIVSLLKLSPRRFKIDRQLVEPVTRGAEHRRLVSTMVEIGKSLGIEVVAEGVETLEQANILRDLGCDYLQGYAFARPMPAEDIAGWVTRQEWRCAS